MPWCSSHLHQGFLDGGIRVMNACSGERAGRRLLRALAVAPPVTFPQQRRAKVGREDVEDVRTTSTCGAPAPQWLLQTPPVASGHRGKGKRPGGQVLTRG